MSQAAIHMLQRRWDLPDAAAPVLERFFTSWAAGHTSLELSDEEAGLLAGSAAVTNGSDDSSPRHWSCEARGFSPGASTRRSPVWPPGCGNWPVNMSRFSRATRPMVPLN